MTPRPRTTLGGIRLTPARLLLVLATVLLPCGTATAHEPGPKPSDSTGSPASPEPSLAGTVAGEGRLRPGRPQGPAVAVEGDDDQDAVPDDDQADDPEAVPDDGQADDPDGATATEPAGSDAGNPSATAAQPPRDAVLGPASPQPPPVHQAIAPGQDDGTEPVLDILPLGSGLVLVGLGLGLAFIGLRVRRS
ncbi:hypothetical protein [Streptomyces arenae]|uniref:hypothetical protein n=1 Tax=Streptomyces arenae TaxID=29301 RepID=UPI002659D686|nr:hypothetical protein [Streptomyces arenae]MCG7204306.1 hypothetical protein [Streptomyces arenae]